MCHYSRLIKAFEYFKVTNSWCIIPDMLRDGEVPEGRAEAAVVQKVAHRVRYGTLEPLQGAAYLVDSVHRHHQRTIRIANQNGGEYPHRRHKMPPHRIVRQVPLASSMSGATCQSRFFLLNLGVRVTQVTTSSEDRETLCLDDIKFSPGDHNHNGRDRDLLDRHLDSLSMSSSSSACSALSWDSSPSVSCTAFILKKEPSEDLEEDEEHEVRPSRICMRIFRVFCSQWCILLSWIYDVCM